MRRGFSTLLMLAAIGAVGPMPPEETRATTSPPPEVPPYPGPLERPLAVDPVALSRAAAKRARRNATRLAGASSC